MVRGSEGMVAERGIHRNDLAGFAKRFAVGGISAAVAKTTVAPMERVKLLMQTQDTNPLINSGRVPRYTGVFRTLRRLCREQGTLSPWRGNLTDVMRYFPAQGLNFAFRGIFVPLIASTGLSSTSAHFAAGGLAGACSLVIVYPLDYARARLATDVGTGRRTFAGLGDCIAKTVQSPAGARGLYNGLGLSMIGVVLYRSAYFGCYEMLRPIPSPSSSGTADFFSRFAVAQVTVLAANYLVYPIDTVRRRLQMQSEKAAHERMYRGALHCATQMLATGGVQSFYRGYVANIARTVGAALVLALYDTAQQFL